VIIGGGPGGYEAALVAAQLGADVTLVEAEGPGGACVLTDCVPSKTFIASSEVMTGYRHEERLGIRSSGLAGVSVDAKAVNERVKKLALAQSGDIQTKLIKAGVNVVRGRARLGEDRLGHTHQVLITPHGGETYPVEASTVLLATGATPRVLSTARPDAERILDWRQVWDLEELPSHLVVIGSGVTGAEFASAYLAMGVKVTLISSRERVMPHEDADAAMAIERVFRERGMTILSQSRGDSVVNTGDGVLVTLSDGRTVEGSHCLMAVGAIPNTAELGLREYGVDVNEGGYVSVDRVSRTNVPGIYAAGDCTGVLPLASVAAMQGRIAIWHAMGEAVAPLRLRTVSANVFTDPELATVGVSQNEVPGASGDASADRQRAGQDVRAAGRVREAVLPAGDRADRRRCRGGAEGERADPADHHGDREQPDRRSAGTHHHDLPVALRLYCGGSAAADAARDPVTGSPVLSPPKRARIQPAVPKITAAMAARPKTCQADWVIAVPPRCPTSPP
jgi:pyruvate/2-oxoglutarate dehydrogenase complex dihydrolipoamide dehydrogenase (E3) component